jgi:M6 family metalloprotease-like protein
MKARKTRARVSLKFVRSITLANLLLAVFAAAPIGVFAQSGHAAPSGGQASESAQAAKVRALNNSLLQLHGQMQEGSQSGTAWVRGQAATVIAGRAAALTTLMQQDARVALSFAFSPELLADLAQKFPQSAALLESHVTLNGPIEHWIEDNTNLKTSRSYFFLKAGGRTLNLHFAGPEPVVKSGELLQATGVVVGSEMAVLTAKSVSQSGAVTSNFRPSSAGFPLKVSTACIRQWFLLVLLLCCGVFAASRFHAALRSARLHLAGLSRQFAVCGIALAVLVCSPFSSSAQTCSTTGAQNVAVLLVTFPGVTPPSNITQQSVYDMFFSTTGPSLDGYWRAASYGQTSATGNVFGWYTLDSSYANCSNLAALRDAAITAAASAGVQIQNYNRIFIMTTDFGCGWTGLALGVCTTLSSPNGSFTASTSFLDASWQGSQTEGAENAAHEGGHNMGLDHAQSRTFGTEPLGPLGAAGTLTEYGDPFSDMSTSNIGHYALPHKAETLNWISGSTNYQVVQSSGTWALQPLEFNPAGLVALKVQRGTGNNAWLWVEYRQNISIYDSIWNPSGALIHYEDSTTGAHTQLLDFTPATSSMYDSALMPGSTWVDPYSNVSITVQSATTTGLTVSVSYGAVPCTAGAPGISVSPLDPSIYPGQTASYSVTVTNNDSSGCSSSTINLGSSEPSGWSTSLSASSVTLSPGQSASVTMGKGAPSGTPAGTYAVNLSASSTSSSSSGTANATVMTPPSLAVNVSVSGSSFTRPGTVPITASVTNGGTPTSGASVTFTLTAPNGSTATQTATTGTNGTATWNYKLNAKSLAGTYSVSAQAALSSGSGGGKKTSASTNTQTATSNTASFAVQ